MVGRCGGTAVYVPTADGAAIPVCHPGDTADDILVPRMKNADALDDNALLDRVLAGDTAAFEQLYDRHSKAAYGLAMRILGEQGSAEDVVQDAFLTVWRQAETYGQERGSVRSWLLAIVH